MQTTRPDAHHAVLRAGFGRRAIAWCLDALFVSPLVLIVVYTRTDWHVLWSDLQALQLQVDGRMMTAAMNDADFLSALISLWHDASVQVSARHLATGLLRVVILFACAFALCSGIWHVFWETRNNYGASPGKRLLDLQVVTADTHQALRLPQAIARHLAGTLSWLSLNVGHLMAALPPEHTALHDRLSGTRVLIRAASSHS